MEKGRVREGLVPPTGAEARLRMLTPWCGLILGFQTQQTPLLDPDQKTAASRCSQGCFEQTDAGQMKGLFSQEWHQCTHFWRGGREGHWEGLGEWPSVWPKHRSVFYLRQQSAAISRQIFSFAGLAVPLEALQ